MISRITQSRLNKYDEKEYHLTWEGYEDEPVWVTFAEIVDCGCENFDEALERYQGAKPPSAPTTANKPKRKKKARELPYSGKVAPPTLPVEKPKPQEPVYYRTYAERLWTPQAPITLTYSPSFSANPFFESFSSAAIPVSYSPVRFATSAPTPSTRTEPTVDWSKKKYVSMFDDPNYCSYKVTPAEFASAVEKADEQLINKYLAIEPRMVNVESAYFGEPGRYPLARAIMRGHLSMSQLLLSRGAKIQSTDGFGKRAIDYVNENVRSASKRATFLFLLKYPIMFQYGWNVMFFSVLDDTLVGDVKGQIWKFFWHQFTTGVANF